MNQQLLTIIIPVYNARSYLAQCLDSLFKQLPPSVEVILLNDGSTDGSDLLCEQYAARHPQIRLFHSGENQGVAAERSKGVALAAGEYIAWIDADDWVLPTWYQTIQQTLMAEKPDILLFDQLFSADGVETPQVYGRDPGAIEQAVFLDDIVQDIRLLSGLCNKIIKKSLYQKEAFDPALSCLEDYDVLHRLVMRADKIIYVPETLYAYRVHADSLTNSIDFERKYQNCLVAEKRRREVKQQRGACSVVGVVIQLRSFLRDYEIQGRPATQKQHADDCRALLRKHLPALRKETVWSAREKIKCTIYAFPLLSRLSWLWNALRK